MHTESISPPSLPIGKIKTFGRFGPKYQVKKMLRQSHDGEWLASVLMLESGEETEYSVSHLLADPEAE